MTPRPTRRRQPAALASVVVGTGLGVVALAYVVRTLLRDREDLEEAARGASPAWLALALVLATLAMVAMAVPWHRAIRLLSDSLPVPQVVARYFVGELGKYVPGGIWPVLGRGELAARWGVGRGAAYGSVALSLVALYLANALVVTLSLPLLVGGDDGASPAWAGLLLLVGILALNPAVVGGLLALARRLLRRPLDLPIPSWGQAVGLVLGYVPAWLAVGGGTWAVARALDPGAPVLETAAAAVLSWLVGFVLVPVPGGVGVREAAFVAASGLDPGVAAAVAVIARVLFVAVDVVGAAAGSLYLGRRRRSAGADVVLAEPTPRA